MEQNLLPTGNSHLEQLHEGDINLYLITLTNAMEEETPEELKGKPISTWAPRMSAIAQEVQKQ